MVFWRFWGWRCENIVFWPPKDTTLREYASVGVSHVKIGSTASALGPWKDFEYKEEEKLSGNFGYMGEVIPGPILTKCGLWWDMLDVITCAIFCDCRLRGVGVVRGVNLLSPIDLTRRSYNTGHTTCDRVMAVSLAISEIFIVKEWPDLEIWVSGCSRLLKMARFDRPCVTFY